MARRTQVERTPLAEAIRSLREHFEETQEEFSKRLNVTIGTLARYETNAQPNVRTLRLMRDLAIKAGQRDLAEFFKDYLSVSPHEQRHPASMGNAIQMLRIWLRLSQQDLAQKSGLPVATIAKCEAGSQPTMKTLRKLADFAREQKQFRFVNVFEGQPPAGKLYLQAVEEIYNTLFPYFDSDIEPYHRQKRIAIALSKASDSTLTKVEKLLAPELLQVDEDTAKESKETLANSLYVDVTPDPEEETE